EVRGLVGAGKELTAEATDRAATAERALPPGLPERERLDAALHAEREDLGQRGLDRVARTVVHELGHQARPDGTDVHRLVAERVEHGLVLVEHGAIPAPPTRQLS